MLLKEKEELSGIGLESKVPVDAGFWRFKVLFRQENKIRNGVLAFCVRRDETVGEFVLFVFNLIVKWC